MIRNFLIGTVLFYLIIGLYFLKRNSKVCKYMKSVLARRNGDFEKLTQPSGNIEETYDKILWSIKPIKDKYWIK